MNTRMSLWMLVASTIVLGACHPSDRCGEGLVLRDNTCRKCPASSTWDDGTCVCDQPDYYRFDGEACVLIDDANVPPMPDAGGNEDAGGGGGATCGDYCAFATSCMAGNSLAASIIGDVISAIHADDAAQCASFCEDTVDGDGTMDPAVACMAAGLETTMCDTMDGVPGLTATLTLVGDCCGSRAQNPLCAEICTALKANATVGGMVTFCP